ncbi:50S ribosomal protein L35 [Candidatus Roizmanbacteria bacterium CG_4_10_14_3_um_filter_39_13]|uniref:Large ribosomal subunit protein bL35 n=4 Tax=Candidatus Roizmaniibacteriota TaxID=1752723 RepID=A0A2H0KLC7_9BACT|nr:MAG: 50S ribosomal protein L35 [Candidatus Roizmanbacteria bacterium CG11_big_fil_rev_8_21_14_0_20_37_16]PIV08293.1 MAG: 50S ribosomal protein L35 [Candidatus Roizmanbacteria bacterium CG03_land_8_20_14_0_80_39_12]PIX68442.1 MAG: 50S ribosomal protein L35 [Candidatus Roizmanbacteria bacterium CG_4_10_14_3_um_filter_39_13]
MKVKTKTRKSAAKRFKVTKNGKILHRQQNLRHLRTVKGKRNQRRLKVVKELGGKFASKIKKMMGLK